MNESILPLCTKEKKGGGGLAKRGEQDVKTARRTLHDNHTHNGEGGTTHSITDSVEWGDFTNSIIHEGGKKGQRPVDEEKRTSTDLSLQGNRKQVQN